MSIAKGVSSFTALCRYVHERRGALAVAGGNSDTRRPASAAVDGSAVRLQDLQLHWVRYTVIYTQRAIYVTYPHLYYYVHYFTV